MIADFLNTGRNGAVTLKDLSSITGIDGRGIRRLIAQERRAGFPILSDSSTGYYLAGDDSERAQFVKSMRHRAQEIMAAADAVERKGGRES